MNSDFAYLDLILFAGVAVYLIFRLRSVLGQRHGEERQQNPFAPPPPRGQAGDPPPFAPPPGAGPAQSPPPFEAAPVDVARTGLVAGLEAISAADPNFRAGEFIGGARSAFEMIVKSFAEGDLPTLQGLLSERLYQLFAAAVNDRKARGLTAETIVERIIAAEILGARIEGASGQVTVRFDSEQINVIRNAAGQVVEGDPDQLVRIEDVWTFARTLGSANPNWQLVQTGVKA